MKKVLLHSCCAPCSSAIIEWMMNNGITPVVYYCNPNIYPEEEYYIRKNEITKYVKNLGLEIIDDDSNENWKGWNCYHNSWLKEIEGMESEPERGLRCLKCFKVRLLNAAETAVREGIDSFTTTLASSRWKSIEQINEAGQWAAETVNARFSSPRVAFDGRNWRKGGLQQRRNELLKQNGFYNQLYCGCEFSFRPQSSHSEDIQ